MEILIPVKYTFAFCSLLLSLSLCENLQIFLIFLLHVQFFFPLLFRFNPLSNKKQLTIFRRKVYNTPNPVESRMVVVDVISMCCAFRAGINGITDQSCSENHIQRLFSPLHSPTRASVFRRKENCTDPRNEFIISMGPRHISN